MTQQEIESFLTIAECNSLTQAAKILFITQPTLSHRLSSLEKELGVTLFNRSKGRKEISLTPQGIAFLPQALKWKQLWEETTLQMTQTAPTQIRIAVALSIDTYIFPEVFWRFMKRGLPVRLKTFTPLYQEAYHMLEQRQIDIAFYSMTQYSQNIISTPVYKEELIFLCSPGSHYSNPVNLSELTVENEIYIGKPSQNGWCPEFVHWHTKHFTGKHTPYLQQTNTPVLDNVFIQPDLWAIMPISIALPYMQTHKVETRKMFEPTIYRTVYMLQNKKVSSDNYPELIYENIRQTIADIPGFLLD